MTFPEDNARIVCPYCAAEVEIRLDPAGGRVQRYVEDCEVCCRPWHLTVVRQADGRMSVEARTEEE